VIDYLFPANFTNHCGAVVTTMHKIGSEKCPEKNVAEYMYRNAVRLYLAGYKSHHGQESMIQTFNVMLVHAHGSWVTTNCMHNRFEIQHDGFVSAHLPPVNPF
jgi:hypothetical protein